MDMAKLKKAKAMMSEAMAALDSCMEGGESEDMPMAESDDDEGDSDMAAKSLKMKMAKYREA